MPELSRRHFLVLIPAGAAVFAAACGSNAKNDCDGAGTDMATGAALIAISSCDGGHTHDFTVMDTDLATPPAAGVSGNSTPYDDDGHVHTVTLAQTDLANIQAGGTVTVTSGVSLNHTHVFTFKKA
jgi:hypothetical protein